MTTKILSGRSALVTGANQGLGLAIAKALVEAGAGVMLCARDAPRLETARAEVAALASPGQSVLAMPADVSRHADVDALVAVALQAFPDLEILVNNAGVYGPMGLIEDVDWDAWVRAIEINVFGSILMCRALVPHFRRRRYGKIIQLSGGGATNPLPRLTSYAASKAAIVRFAESLALEVKDAGIDVNSIAPGALNTRMMEELLAAGPAVVGEAFFARMKRIADEGGTPLDVGASLAVFLASAESDGISGRLLSAVWDPWKDLPAHRADLDRSDVYTLRRVMPADRGLGWGDVKK
jgi:NAD(P)-dependent dehydrogenase (short-subunit alcohol dehydrogenase family)